MKTHYLENWKAVCGTSNITPKLCVATRTDWYNTPKQYQCDKCKKQIAIRTGTAHLR